MGARETLRAGLGSINDALEQLRREGVPNTLVDEMRARFAFAVSDAETMIRALESVNAATTRDSEAYTAQRRGVLLAQAFPQPEPEPIPPEPDGTTSAPADPAPPPEPTREDA